jgi:rubredoxin
MTVTTRMQCKVCASAMVYFQQRGSSAGEWLCPVCGAKRRVMFGKRDEEAGLRPRRGNAMNIVNVPLPYTRHHFI